MKKDIKQRIQEEILVLDGAMGTMIQRYALGEDDYRRGHFEDCKCNLLGCNDLLVFTREDIISSIHRKYLESGADIIETNTFNANSISMEDYGLSDIVYDLNIKACQLARSLADEYTAMNPSKPRYVAGSIGPTNRTASISPDVEDPAFRAVNFDDLVASYSTQIEAMVDGGVDLLLIETVFDTLNAKAALFAAQTVFEKRGLRLPIMVSGTVTDASGRNLSGQSVEAFYVSIAHADLFSVGLNCAFGAQQLKPLLTRLCDIADCNISSHPNAGLPNGFGAYDQTPEVMAGYVEEYLKEGLVNIIGGCCGTSPDHIAAIAAVAKKYSPRKRTDNKKFLRLSGLDVLNVDENSNFINIGERTNVAGSAKFARLIRENKYDEALSIARQQVEGGAQIIDVCMDDGMIDGVGAMTRFLNLIASEPDISRVPIMVDSSSWEVIEAGLKCVQGKGIVNSCSLKEGETEFLRKANLVKKYGAALVVMLFDEKGQADTYERKIEVAARAYKLLTESGFGAENIIFDPNVLAIATGIENHDSYGVDFIRACEWIKNNCPSANISGGVSNLSFSFRGNNTIREAIHSVFLYHAIQKGMNMGIVNPSMLQVYSDIDPELLNYVEDLVLNKRPDVTERLSQYIESHKNSEVEHQEKGTPKWRTESLEDRVEYALVKGIGDFIPEDIAEALTVYSSPLEIIEKLLMRGMAKVGELFGSGKMFLPQVVKSARVMKHAVGILNPYIEKMNAGEAQSATKVLLATVKGDVHDIGKNIVSVVLACNGYKIIDLGVMVQPEDIVEQAIAQKVDYIGLSGLITPSLDEMTKVVKMLRERGVDIPVLIGGATTSDLHTTVKIAPFYDGLVMRVKDASDDVQVLSKLNSSSRAEYMALKRAEQEKLRREYEKTVKDKSYISIKQARENGFKSDYTPVEPNQSGRIMFKNYPLDQVAQYIDWTFFFLAWDVKGRYPQILGDGVKGEAAVGLKQDAQKMLDKIITDKLLTANAVLGIYPARRESDDIVLLDRINKKEILRLPQLRNQEQNKPENLSLADFISDKEDYMGLFMVSVAGADELAAEYQSKGDDYSAIMVKILADRLAEAFAELLHKMVRKDIWGYANTEELTVEELLRGKYQGIRPAYGYPACPDHSVKADIFKFLNTEEIGLNLTESYMMTPAAAVSGMMIANKDAKYFTVDKIQADQLAEYAAKRGMTKEKLEKIMPQHIIE